jgi:hypothetical protein
MVAFWSASVNAWMTGATVKSRKKANVGRTKRYDQAYLRAKRLMLYSPRSLLERRASWSGVGLVHQLLRRLGDLL